MRQLNDLVGQKKEQFVLLNQNSMSTDGTIGEMPNCGIRPAFTLPLPFANLLAV